MVRHFENKIQAKKFIDNSSDCGLSIFKKLKGHKNRFKKPFVVCDHLEWLNLY